MTPIEITDAPTSEDARTVLDGLSAFNEREVGPADRRSIGVFLRERTGGPVVGGLTGYTGWNWLFVGNLWLGEALRGTGAIGELLSAAEGEAVRRGCRSAWLDTFNPVARGAYERCGYEVCGELPNFVAGRSRFILRKALT